MKHFLYALLVALGFAAVAHAQVNSPTIDARFAQWSTVQGTAGTSATAAISAGSVLPGVQGWRICNNGTNASTYLAVSNTATPGTDGQRIGLGQCYACLSCTAGLLKSMNVQAQAASNGYSVVQFKQ